jgi:hypothetical protein
MPRIFLDTREIASPVELSSLNEILKYVEDKHLPPDCVIRQIRLDGLPLDADSLRAESPESAWEIGNRQKVEIVTGTVNEIAFDSIAEALAYLDRIETLIPSLAESFQTSPGPEAYERLRQLYEGFYWLNLLLEKLQAKFGVNLEEIRIKQLPAREHFHKFASILRQLIGSQEQRDFVLISDLLQYEIYPLIPVWKEMFEVLSERVESAG